VFQTRAVTVSTTPVVLTDPGAGAIIIRNPGPTTVYITTGAADTVNGFPINAGETLSIDTDPVDDDAYAVTASGTQVINILRSGF
jgi:hypothetical protein